jgi:hypothetical protein
MRDGEAGLWLGFGTAIVCAVALGACAGASGASPSAPRAGATSDPDGGAAPGADDASAAASPAERPFAGSVGEATQLISQAIDEKSGAIQRCVDDYRARKKLTHERVSITVGIDQDGHVLGVTLPKGAKDTELSTCAQRALRQVPFPRSHSGVISVTRTYEEIVR